MNVIRSTYPLLIWSFFIFSPGLLTAQSGDAGIENSIKQHIQSFADAYATLPESRNKAFVLSHFSKDMQSNIFYFGISGRARVTNSNYAGFSEYLDKMLRASGVMIKYDIKNFLYVRSIDDMATAMINVAYELKEDDGIWVKGEETASYALRKQADGWKIVHMTIMGMEDEKLKGNCLCELFVEEGNATGVVAKTTVPSGRSYTSNFNDFDFRNADGSWMIKSGNNTYRWDRSGDVFKIDESGADPKPIGSSSSKKEIVLILLSKDLYGDNCANIKVKATN
jgi:hypothetical protein